MVKIAQPGDEKYNPQAKMATFLAIGG